MTFEELKSIGESERAGRKETCVRCCMSTGCMSSGASEIKEALEKAVVAKGLEAKVEVRRVGCVGLCGKGPLVGIDPGNQLFEQVTPETAPSIIDSLVGGIALPAKGDPNHPFYARQTRIVGANSGRIDPERIEDYIAAGGYQSLHKAIFEMTPAEVVEEISHSGLRGRGGAGFPTGIKWATVAKANSDTKYVVCNGDEGDPGAFMDSSTLESSPHSVLEGMAIAAYAVGAQKGFLFVRAEYPLAISRLQIAIRQAVSMGVLGADILESTFSFNVEVRIGAGAFVCGEETALIASIEGGRGQPRPRPPFPAESGLWGKPTLINNVETFANIAAILEHGAAWYASFGTATSKGTKVFSLTGCVRNNGLIEVPMGMTLREIVEDLGGGATEGRTIKAVQTGGPSGGCVPASLFDLPVDYETLTAIGSIMGSGGMIVLDDRTNMVELAKFYIDFCVDESCGKCIPCRAGTVQISRLLAKLLDRKGTLQDLDQLQELCDMVKHTSLCGLGQTAPNPVLCSMRHFREDYLALISGSSTPRVVAAACEGRTSISDDLKPSLPHKDHVG